MSKSEFVRSLQSESRAMRPPEIGQRVREKFGFISSCQWDPRLDVRMQRGYMMPQPVDPHRTPDNPQHYTCIFSLDQPKPWQDLVWIKEIIGILDHPSHRTTDKEALGRLLDNRESREPHQQGTPLNVMADKNGVALALGCAVPLAYRNALRAENALDKYSVSDLEQILSVPAEFFEWLFGADFENDFERALRECDQDIVPV